MRHTMITVLMLLTLGAGSLAFAAADGDSPVDVQFIDMTMKHHQDGIEMSRLAESKATGPPR